MECPECQSTHIRQNGKRRGKQNHLCVNCGRQFVEALQTQRGYGDDVQRLCLKMSVNGVGFRAIERLTEMHHTTVLDWVKQVGSCLPDADEPEAIPEVRELDEWPTFVGSTKTKSGFGPW